MADEQKRDVLQLLRDIHAQQQTHDAILMRIGCALTRLEKRFDDFAMSMRAIGAAVRADGLT
jgi:hypothetical protein